MQDRSVKVPGTCSDYNKVAATQKPQLMRQAGSPVSGCPLMAETVNCSPIIIFLSAKSLQSCPTLCDPIDSSPPGSPIPGILKARTLERVAISFSNAGKVKSESEVAQSCLTLSDPMDCSPPGSSVHGIFQARVLKWGASAFSAYSFLSFGKIIIVTDTYIMLPLCQALS